MSWLLLIMALFEEVGVYCFAHVGRSVDKSITRELTPNEIWGSRSKVKVTVTFKLGGASMFHKHFLLL